MSRAVVCPALQSVDLLHNLLDTSGLAALWGGTWAGLQGLTLDCCGLEGSKGAAAIDMITDTRRVVHLKLKVLSLSGNLLNRAAIASMTHVWILELQELYLSQVCQSGNLLRQLVCALEGVVLLLRDTLEVLDLSGHGSQGAEQYCKALPWSQYVCLKLMEKSSL